LLWDYHTGHLLMTDITQGKLMEVHLDSESVRSWQFDEPLAWVLKTTDSKKYVLGLKSGIAIFDTKDPGGLHWINNDFPGHQLLRLNDACVAPGGLIWYGSMNMVDSSGKDGQLASFSISDGLQIHDQGFTVTNGPVISPDGQSLFFSDTLQATIYRYRLSADSKSLLDRQVFARFDADQGYPDGMCFDKQGNLWIAMWGAASIVQLDPHGLPLLRISVPALNVTNVCFCGPSLDRLMVSTASIDMGPEEMQQFPESGALFEVLNHHSAGVPTYSVKLDSSWT
jgi:xylono-1,5-lactonase